MRDAPRRRRERCHAAVDAAVEEGDEAAAVVDDMDQLGEMARWRMKGERYGKRCRDLFEVAAGEVLKCSLYRKEQGHLLQTCVQRRGKSNLFSLSLLLGSSS